MLKRPLLEVYFERAETPFQTPIKWNVSKLDPIRVMLSQLPLNNKNFFLNGSVQKLQKMFISRLSETGGCGGEGGVPPEDIFVSKQEHLSKRLYPYF